MARLSLRGHFALAFTVRTLAKSGISTRPITRPVDDDPAHALMRQIMALVQDDHAKDEAKHVLTP